MIEMSSGIGATTMGIGVSHGTGGGEGVAGGCRLRAQSQSQGSGSTSQHSNPQQSSQQQQQQQQQQTPSSQQQQSQQQQRQGSGALGRSKKDNCCLCWCCCCSCSNKCLAAVGGNSGVAGGAGDQGKKKGNAGEHGGVGVGGDHAGGGAGNGLDGLDGLDGNMDCSLEEIRSWGSSFDKLMRSPAGRKIFKEFLVSEYSEENIAFWLACEQLKSENNPEKIEERAHHIYTDYISILSPKEVSLDSQVREIVNRNMTKPTPHTFDEAQLQIYTLMHRDSYPRFINSELYRRVARLDSRPPSP